MTITQQAPDKFELSWGTDSSNPFRGAELSNCKNLLKIRTRLEGSADLKNWSTLSTQDLDENGFHTLANKKSERYFWRMAFEGLVPKNADVLVICHQDKLTQCFKKPLPRGHEKDASGPCPDLGLDVIDLNSPVIDETVPPATHQ